MYFSRDMTAHEKYEYVNVEDYIVGGAQAADSGVSAMFLKILVKTV